MNRHQAFAIGAAMIFTALPLLGTPSLAGQPVYFTHWQLIKYRDGRRRDPQMTPLAEKLGDLPLALHLAGSYLRTYRAEISLGDYVAELERGALIRHASRLLELRARTFWALIQACLYCDRFRYCSAARVQRFSLY